MDAEMPENRKSMKHKGMFVTVISIALHTKELYFR
jgi:hypothetical protein